MADVSEALSKGTEKAGGKPKKNWLNVLSNAFSGAKTISDEYIGTAQPLPDTPIEKPFYQKGWFIGSAIGLVVLVLVYFLFIHKKKAK